MSTNPAVQQRTHSTYMGGKASTRNLVTPVGSRCHELGITAHKLSMATGIHSRTLSDYLANRVPIRPHHMPLLTQALDCPPGRLIGEPEGGYPGVVERVTGSE